MQWRIIEIDNHLNKIFCYVNISYKEFMSDWKIQDIIEYNLFQIVNHLVDIIEHIVVDENYGMPNTAYEAVKILQEKKIIDEHTHDLLKEMIGFRNVIGHEYMNIDKKVVHNILTSKLDDIKGVNKIIVEKYLT